MSRNRNQKQNNHIGDQQELDQKQLASGEGNETPLTDAPAQESTSEQADGAGDSITEVGDAPVTDATEVTEPAAE